MEFKLVINKILHLFEIRRIQTNKKVVYLTFDDGPEGDITDWVLDELKKYQAKATFFCKGENVLRNDRLYNRIVSEGHAIGNHTYHHINAFEKSAKEYVDDVELANGILKTNLFRPPWGALTLSSFLNLVRRYRIIYWSLLSGDTEFDQLNLEQNMQKMYSKTRPGEIVLFHSCKRHENETRQILPIYLEWLDKNGYECKPIK